jgi:hypothetical protein
MPHMPRPPEEHPEADQEHGGGQEQEEPLAGDRSSHDEAPRGSSEAEAGGPDHENRWIECLDANLIPVPRGRGGVTAVRAGESLSRVGRS